MTQRVLVVGGTSGIGRALAMLFATRPAALVTVVGRNAQAAEEMINSPGVNGRLKFLRADVSLMRDIRRAADEYKRENPSLDVLILTQGILTMAGRTETVEGIDNKMALHYYGRMLWIREMLPIMPQGARVLTVLDAVRGNLSNVNWDDMDLKHSFGVSAAANHCISFNNTMVQHFSQHHPNITFVHGYPGFVKTAIGRNLPWFARWPAEALSFLATAPEVCAANLAKGLEAANGWARINEKGVILAKPPAPEDLVNRLAEHTWKIVDTAL